MSVEQSAFNSFTRGGQYFNHFLRMAKNNVVSYLILAFLVSGFLGFFKWERTTDDHDAYILGTELTYTVIIKVNPNIDKEVRVKHADGSESVVQMRDRMRSDAYAQDVMRAQKRAKGALVYGGSFGLLTLLSVILAAGLIGWVLGTDKYLRGARLGKIGEVKRVISKWNRQQAKIMGAEDYEPYRIVGVPYPLRSETQHTMFVGSTGSGKTQGISEIVAQIKDRGDRGIVYDKMRSFVSRFYDPATDYILNPLDARCPPWDIFADARDTVDWENMAQAIIPDDEQSKFWISAARQVFATTASRYQKEARQKNIKPKVSELMRRLVAISDEHLHRLLAGSVAALHINPANERLSSSVRATLGDAIRSLGYIRDPEEGEKAFSIREWIKDDDKASVVFLTSRDDIHATLQPLLTMWITIFTSALMSQPRSSSRLIWFILDELPSLHKLPGLEASLAEARQYGAAYLIGIQLISQLRDLYGNHKADSIIGLSRNKVVFNPGDPMTAKVMSDFIGKTEVLRREHGISIGAEALRDGQTVSSRKTMESIVLPEELAELMPLNGILKYTGPFPACRIKVTYLNLDGPQPGFMLDSNATSRADAAYDLKMIGITSAKASAQTVTENTTPSENTNVVNEAPRSMEDIRDSIRKKKAQKEEGSGDDDALRERNRNNENAKVSEKTLDENDIENGLDDNSSVIEGNDHSIDNEIAAEKLNPVLHREKRLERDMPGHFGGL